MSGPRLSDPGMTADDALAMDLVLGILRAEDHAAAHQRTLGDPAFAALVAGHQARLFPTPACAIDTPQPDLLPRRATWDGIKAKLPGQRED